MLVHVPDSLVLVIHAGDQFDSIRNSTKTYLFNTAVVRTGGMYAHKPDEVLQRNLPAGIISMDAVVMHMIQPEYMTAAVNQAVIALVVVAERCCIMLPFLFGADIYQLVVTIEFYHHWPADHAR
jgi:hypothetical protein